MDQVNSISEPLMTGLEIVTETTSFATGQAYRFNTPIEADCCSCNGGPWTRKVFSEGWCFGYDGKRKGYTFRGSPVDEGVDNLHFFLF